MNYEVKRKVFISFCQRDRQAVDIFIEKWVNKEEVFIPKVLGVSDNDDFINSDNPDYVMNKIREKYLSDSTVTIVLIGTCTHSRRYVDWELKSSLRRGSYTPNGLLGILLPGNSSAHLPPRFKANWNKEHYECYARYKYYPNSTEELISWIEDVYDARTSRVALIKNDAEMMKYNTKCKVCGITH